MSSVTENLRQKLGKEIETVPSTVSFHNKGWHAFVEVQQTKFWILSIRFHWLDRKSCVSKLPFSIETASFSRSCTVEHRWKCIVLVWKGKRVLIRFWRIIIISLCHLVLRSWGKENTQSLVYKLLLQFSWHMIDYHSNSMTCWKHPQL